MQSLQHFLASKAKIRIAAATLMCLVFLGVLWEGWNKGFTLAGIESSNLSLGTTDTDYGSLSLEDPDGNVWTSGAWNENVPRPAEATKPAIVAGAVHSEPFDLMPELSADYDLYPFIVTNSSAPPHLLVPANKGREAMVYLSYLIYNYDNLPPYAIFTHGHRQAWHQDRDIVTMIRDLHVDRLEEVNYISLRFSWSPSCPAELRPKHHDAVVWGDGDHVRETEDAIGEAWTSLFPNEELPDTIASQCCAQFAVTRAAMRRRSKKDYIRMRQWLLDTPLEDSVSGRVFEKLWAYIMLGEAVHCPAPQKSACEYFGYCEEHYWPEPPAELGPLPTAR